VKSVVERKSIGYLGGDIGLIDNEYMDYAAKKLGVDLSSLKDTESLEYQIKLGNISEEKGNADILALILKTLNPLSSYSLGFVVYHKLEHSFKTIGAHYLVNNTTNAYDLMKDVYRKAEDIRLRYSFLASDMLLIKF
jgi:hypothetical protein